MGKASKRVGVAQFHRLTRIVSLLKQNRMPTAQKIVADLKLLDVVDNIDLDCSVKTVLRDINTLKYDFEAPIKFSRSGEGGYYLEDRDWEFISPALVDENEMMAAVIGAKVAEDIIPDPLKSQIRRAVDELLKCNNPEFLGDGHIESLKIFSDEISNERPDIFMTVFNGWLTSHTLNLEYENRDGSLRQREVDPHALVYFDNVWSIKGYCHWRKENRTFLTSRIHMAEMTSKLFVPDKEVVDSLTIDKFLNFEKIPDVKIRLTTESARKFAMKKRMHSMQKITLEKDGTFLFSIPAVSAEVVVPWILAQRGEAIPIAPDEICNRVEAAAKKIIESMKERKRTTR